MVEKEVKKDESKVKTLVVAELPTQPMNKARDESGNEFDLMTTTDALTEILEIARSLKKGLL